MEILNDLHVPHDAYVLPYTVWKQWRCNRNVNKYGRITLVLLGEPSAYRLTLVVAENRRVIKATTDPKTWQEVIGSMAMEAWFDDLTPAGHSRLAKNGFITFTFEVRPG
jgi:hypothetical protein